MSRPYRNSRSPTPAFATGQRTPIVSGLCSARTIRSGRGRSPSPSTRRTTVPLARTAAPVVAVGVDAARVVGKLRRVWELIGSERLSQLLLDGDQKWIADEFATALRRVHDDLGVQRVRAHAILHDDNNVVRTADDGTVAYEFDRVDAIYDHLLDIGIRPVVELSFMPAALARDPQQTVFTYRGIISPPADWSQWRALITALAEHLIDRYGIDEVTQWSFEVWNEPNLVVFWTGTVDEYLRLYEESARALKAVDPRLAVGGPSTAAAEWVERLAAHAEHAGVPLDFVTSHTYGNLPLDVRPALARHGFEGTPVWWTEWGVGSTHFGPIHDTAFGAPFVLAGYAVAQHHLDALAYWVASDHFEELGRPDRLFHNGFGLLTVGNLAKPRYWAAHLAAHQGDHVLAHTVDGDGAAVLVQCSATRHDDGTIDVLTWNGTINAAVMSGDSRLDRNVRLEVGGVDPAIALRRHHLPDRRQPLQYRRRVPGRHRLAGRRAVVALARGRCARDRTDPPQRVRVDRDDAPFRLLTPHARRGAYPVAPRPVDSRDAAAAVVGSTGLTHKETP